jgi:N-acetylglucosamine kinase-like BadF-type ATPase
MKRRMPSIVYSVDAGGTGTVVAVWRAGVVVDTSFYPSIAIASTGTTAACQSLSDVLRGIAEYVGKDSWALGCIGSSSMPVAAEAPAPTALLDVIAVHAPRGRVVLVNDVVPLLWSTPLNGVGIVICSGTGSSVLGRDASGEQTKVGGHEHIVSDQGSAYSLAREGLRSAGRSHDGTGPVTRLQSLAESFFDLPIPALGRWLAELPRPRTTIASFGPQVTAAAESGDPVAIAVVETEARALVEAAVVGAARLSFRSPPTIGLAGSVLHKSAYYRKLVEEELARQGLTDESYRNVHLINGARAGAQYARRLATDLLAGQPIPIPDGAVLGSLN